MRVRVASVASVLVLIASWAVPAVGQTPPFSNVTATSPVNEGGATTLSGSYSAPRCNQASFHVEWGDGTSTDFQQAGATGTFSQNHTYADDNPTGTASDKYTITISFVSSPACQTTGQASAQVTANNVAPTFDRVSCTNPSQAGGSTQLSASFADPGLPDTFSFSINWGDGATSTGQVAAGARSLSGNHAYAQGGTYSVAVTLTDDDTGVGTGNCSVTVGSPISNLVATSPVNEGGATTLSGNYSAGQCNQVAFHVEWGDGTSTDFQQAGATGTFSQNHTYADDNPTSTPSDQYTITVSFVPGPGCQTQGQAQASVTVHNVAPTFDGVTCRSPIEPGASTQLTANFTDPGLPDTFSFSINWGDGTTSPGQVAAGARTLSMDHTFAQAGTYAVALTLTDDDTGAATGSCNVVVGSPLRRLIVGSGTSSRVKTFNAETGELLMNFLAYGPSFEGGVRVATGDVNGDGVADIVTGAGSGAGGHVKVFDGATGETLRSFFAFSPSFTGGVFVAAGDVNGDGAADIITGAGPGAGPHVKVFDGTNGAVLQSFFAFAPTFKGGVRVAAGDVNGDGTADLITGAGPGAGPHVKVFDGTTNAALQSFSAFAGTFKGGVWVAAGDVNGDGVADPVVGADAGAGPHIKVFDGATNAALQSFFAYPTNFTGGVRVATGDVNGDGADDVMTGPGSGGSPHVKVFNAEGLGVLQSFHAFTTRFRGGVFVSVD